MKLRGRYVVLDDGSWWLPLDTPQLAWMAALGWVPLTLGWLN